MNGTMLMDTPFPGEPTQELILTNLLIGAPEQVAEKLVAEIRGLKPKHMCFHFQVGNFAHQYALRSIELLASEVLPMVEKELGDLAKVGVTMLAFNGSGEMPDKQLDGGHRSLILDLSWRFRVFPIPCFHR